MNGDRKKRYGLRGAVMFLVVAVLTAGLLAPISVLKAEKVYAATEYSFKANGAAFYVDGMSGVCCQKTAESPSKGKATRVKLSNSSPAAKVAYHYGYLKGFKYSNKGSKSGWTTMKKLMQWAGHEMWGYPAPESSYKSKYNQIKAQDPAPDWFVVYRYTQTKSGLQHFVAWGGSPLKLKLTKKVKKPDDMAKSPAKLPGYNSLKGIKYKVYKKKSETAGNLAGMFVLNKSGEVSNVMVRNTSNSNWTYKAEKTLPLAKGTYYVKEVGPSTPKARTDKSWENYVANPYYKVDSSWHTVNLTKSGQSITVYDEPVPAYLSIKKELTEGSTGEKFSFVITNKNDTSIQFTLHDIGQNEIDTVKVWAGKYTIEEESREGFITTSVSPNPVTVDIEANSTIAKSKQVSRLATVKNTKSGGRVLVAQKILKNRLPGESLEGFHFEIRGELDNYGTLAADDFSQLSQPEVTVENDYSYAWDPWTLSDSDIDVINTAAQNGQTGSYSISAEAEGIAECRLWNDSKYGPYSREDGSTYYNGGYDYWTEPVSAAKTICVELEEAQYNSEENIYENPLTGSETSYTWKGAKTPFRKIEESVVTDNEVVTLTTNEAGFTESITIPKNAGTYTCEEVMTEAQARKFRIVSVNPQTIITPEGESPVRFTDAKAITNIHDIVRIKLKKTSQPAEEELFQNIEFTLTGTDLAGDPIEPVVRETDENGEIDFGEFLPGEYVLEETGFDPTQCTFPDGYRINSYDHPAQKLTVQAGETAVFRFTNVKARSLKLRKIDHNTKEALSGAEFELYQESNLAARFTLDISSMGTYIINMLYTNGEIQPEYLPSESEEEEPDEIIEDDEDDDDITGDDDEPAGGGDSGGSESTGAEGSDEDEEAEKDWGVLKGLKEGVSYTLIETKAPEGYDCDFQQTFTFQDQLEIEAEDVISNHEFFVQKNVTGDLGDLTKEFEYTAEFTGLKPNKDYEYSYMKELITGGDDNEATVGAAPSYHSDEGGNATVHFKMKDGQIVHFVKLPTDATYMITEAASDHVAQYNIASMDEPDNCTIVKKHDTNHTAGSAKPLSTARETIDPNDGMIVITFQNNRDLAPVLGTGDNMPVWFAGLGIITAIASIIGWSMHRRRKLKRLLEEGR